MDRGNQSVLPDSKDATWQYTPDNDPIEQHPPSPTQPLPQATATNVDWTASEFINHDKSSSWYGLLVLGSGIIAAAVYFLTRDVVSTGIIILGALLLGIAAVRKPRILQYSISNNGLSIGQKRYPYKEFKAFAIMQEGAISSILFLPLKRFMPPISIYYDSNDEDRIVDCLSHYLPFERHEYDLMDHLAQRLHF